MSTDPNYYIHESDRAALDSLKAIPGFSQLLKAFMKNWSERQARLRNLSSYVRIDEKQMPEYHAMLGPICEKLGIEEPELYLMMDVRPNAFTSGESKPFIVLTSGLLESFPQDLIPTVLAHECGHIACHHVLYRTMGTVIFGSAAGTLARMPLGALVTLPLQVAFFYWMRCSEYSADRAAVICDGTSDKMAEVCMRFSGMSTGTGAKLNLDAFLEQAREYRSIVSDSTWDKTLEFYMLSSATHPFTAVRALECVEWGKSDQFLSILDGTYKNGEAADEIVCPLCGALNSPDAQFCTSCGGKLSEKAVCPDCGSELDGDEVFCPHCGRKLKE